jgi:hypothetical protein
MIRKQANIQQIKLAAEYIGDNLRKQVIFVGGTLPALFLTDPATPDVRPTDDVDVIIKVTSRQAHADVERELDILGFKPALDEDNPVICRWKKDPVVLDVMPEDETIFGFSNPWYRYAFNSPMIFDLGDGIVVRAINPPLFLCTKIDAFGRRGNDDYTRSQDIEDIIKLFDGRPELSTEIHTADSIIRHYLTGWCKDRLTDTRFLEAITWNLPGDDASQAREQIILDCMSAVAHIRLS